MLARALAFLGLIATIVAGAYAVVGYHFPSDQKPAGAPRLEGGASVSPGAQIRQESRGNNSPNIISGGNVSVGR